MSDLSEMNRHISERLAPIFREFEQAQMEREAEAAKRDPARHRLSKVMERGKSMNYRHWGVVKDKRGRRITYCWSVHRNVAGFFLGWREVETPIKRKRPAKVGEAVSDIKRDQWTARRTKKRLEELQKRRTDALRAKYPSAPKRPRWWISEEADGGHAAGGRTYGLGWVRAADEEAAIRIAAKRWPLNRPGREMRERKAIPA